MVELQVGKEEMQDCLEQPRDNLNSGFSIQELPGIPLVPSVNNPNPGIIFILENASLVPAYVERKFQILNPNEHADFLRKKKMNPYAYRPDIIHEALCEIMSSRLCMAGKVQVVYVKTDQGVLIRVEPHAHIPKSLKSFCAMMSEFLQKFSIKAWGKGGKLLRLIENPVTKYLPVNSVKIGISSSSQRAVKLCDYVSGINNDLNLVFVVGAMAHGKIENDYIDDFISVSSLPLSSAICLAQICIAMERKWRIL